jgi:hypothetical protein
MIDADGAVMENYRKTHIPDGPGYEEKFYFQPGDTGFKVWETAYGNVGVGICWDQWFPETARSLTLMGADMIFYPTAIGSEPEIGVDSARWFFASRSVNTGIDFDIELAKKQSAENPVYYVQYAHARIASIVRKASEVGLAPATDVAGWLTEAPEAALARAVVRFPEVIEDAVEAEETHGITAYATELATTFHAFYRDARVVDQGAPERSSARLALAGATRITLANALGLLGISAPESM